MEERTRSTTWHALAPDAALDALGTGRAGLSADEAARRAVRFGPNEIRGTERTSRWAILLHQFASPLIAILLMALLITVVTAHFADAIVIALVLLINAIIGFTQEYRAENAMQALARLVTPTATVRRGDERREIPSRDLVPGDIVLLESGDFVPADLRILEQSHLRTDDSALTGESVAVGRTVDPIDAGPELPVADRRNMAFLGTAVASGRGRGVVVATGAATEIGQIARRMRETERAETPLQARMQRFGRRVSAVIVIASAVAFVAGLLQGIPVTDMFLAAVAIAVAAIPEGLPIVMTVALAVSVRRMAKRNAVIRRLPAGETLGSCTVIVTDKTGTLTENRMTVQRLWCPGASDEQTFDLTGAALSAHGTLATPAGTPVRPDGRGPLHHLLLAGLLANESDVRSEPHAAGGSLIPHGDPTEVALLVAAIKAGLPREDVLDAWPRVADVPFESERQFSASVNRAPGREDAGGAEGRSDGTGLVVFVKGAPERVLAMCSAMVEGPAATACDGAVTDAHAAYAEAAPVRTRPLDPGRVLAEAHRMAGDGLRVLALAMGRSAAAVESTRRAEPADLAFLGLVGMMDPPREGVPEAIEKARRAGIRAIMCTGDHVSTATAIAARIGIGVRRDPMSAPTDPPAALSGADLLELTDDALSERLRTTSVFARVSPQQKLRVVTLLRGAGEVVAVTGDGVNDAPALKSAHIGCAMGREGTDVAREASEMVLADDNFATIHAAIEEGRTAFSNIRKATDFLISTGVGVVLAVFGAFLLAGTGMIPLPPGSLPLLLLPAQILWLNVVTNGIQDVALAFEPGEEALFLAPPRPPGEGLLSRLLVERTIITGVLMAAVALAMFARELHAGSDLAYAQCATLTALVLFKMLHVGACRSETLSIFRKPLLSNPVLLLGTAVSLLVHIGAMHFGPTRHLLGLEPLRADTWLMTVLLAPVVLVAVEVHKRLRSPGAAS